MAALDLRECDKACTDCIRGYKQKFQLKKGDKFGVPCTGIPKDFTKLIYAEDIPGVSIDRSSVDTTLLDPLAWAAENLDWHCTDPSGEIWKRKTAEGTLGEVPPFEGTPQHIGQALSGRSPYHRPYQSAMLRCSSRFKVFRLGRQLGKTTTLAIAMLYNIFTHDDFNVLVLAPYQSQIDIIFTKIEQLLNSSPLKESVRRNVKAPTYTIQLHNGSSLRGFTSGVKSAGHADAVRGQRADMLVFDEADYMAEEDVVSALAVITNNPKATVWMSSTPTGKRLKFWAACHNQTWREFYYPASVNPLWSEELEVFYRDQLGAAYKFEIEALFGEQEEGVYQKVLVEQAKTDYSYSSMTYNPYWIYCIGVDWNSPKVGTCIRVVGFDPTERHFWVVTRDVIQKEGYTQLEACKKIIQLNRVWHPEWIFVDKGFGTVQDEILRKKGHDSVLKNGPGHPDSRLAKNVVAYESGSTTETRDLFTKQLVKRPAKQFMVEESVRKFEAGVIHFSSKDTILERQLMEYIVKRVTPSGQPVYATLSEKVGDHDLDALNLALVAFTLKMSSFGQPQFYTNIAFSGHFGEKKGLAVAQAGEFGIVHDEKRRQQEVKNKHHPKEGRDENISTRTPPLLRNLSGRLPAANTTRSIHKIGLWAWPGWERDAPLPRRNKGRSIPPIQRKNI